MVLLFLVPVQARGGQRTPVVVEAGAKRDIGANSEELKLRKDKRKSLYHISLDRL